MSPVRRLTRLLLVFLVLSVVLMHWHQRLLTQRLHGFYQTTQWQFDALHRRLEQAGIP